MATFRAQDQCSRAAGFLPPPASSPSPLTASRHLSLAGACQGQLTLLLGAEPILNGDFKSLFGAKINTLYGLTVAWGPPWA